MRIKGCSELAKKGISIYAELGIALYSVKPLISELKELSIPIYLYTRRDNMEKAAGYFGIPSENVIAIEVLFSKWKALLDFIIKEVMVETTFSSQYARSAMLSEYRILRFIKKLCRRLPKPPQSYINAIYHYFWCVFNILPIFKTRTVLYVTRSGDTYLFNSFWHRIYTLVESWDHPVKSPFFVKSEMLFAWNNDLAHDIQLFQGKSKVKTVFPFKFRYIEELKDKVLDVKNSALATEIEFIKCQSYILYVCTYSFFSGNSFFECEKEIIKQVVEVGKKYNKTVYVKPHPHAHQDDFSFLDTYENVRIGIPATKSGFNYIFSEEDQFYKLELLKSADVIINIGTTLVLESSLVNKNILQLCLPEGFSFSEASQNYHVKKYLLNRNGIVFLSKLTLPELEKWVCNPSDSFALGLQKWVYDRSYRESIDLIIGCLLKQ